jgi:hypothetical protein
MSERSTHWPAISFCVHPKASSTPSVNTISEYEVLKTQFREKVTVKFVENAGKMTKW